MEFFIKCVVAMVIFTVGPVVVWMAAAALVGIAGFLGGKK